MKPALAVLLTVLVLLPAVAHSASAPLSEDPAFYSGVITGPDFCVNRSLGGPVTYPVDSDHDGVADVCSLPRTRRAAVARQLAMERLAAEFPDRFTALFAIECAAVALSFGEPEAEAEDECQPFRVQPPVRTRAVTAQTPLRTYVAGDSMTYFLGTWLRSDNRLDVTVDALHSTGLARPDVYDWPSRFVNVLDRQDPELVVLVMGANDTQAMWTAEGTAVVSYQADGWHEEWSRRLNSVLDQFAAPHRHMVWVGLPPTQPSQFRRGYAVLNRLSTEVIAARSDTSFVDIWDLFGGDGPYRADIAPPDGGELIAARQPDGVHLTVAGTRWVADLVVDVAERHWKFEERR